MAHASQVFSVDKSCKPSVRFKTKNEKEPEMTAGFYLNREFAEKMLKVKNLDKVQEIEVTVRIKK